jgi:hypothetical protein
VFTKAHQWKLQSPFNPVHILLTYSFKILVSHGIAQAVGHRGGLGSRPHGLPMWDLWWTKWHSDRFFSESYCFLLSISSYHCSYSLMYHLGDEQWARYRPQFHTDIVSPHCNNDFVEKLKILMIYYPSIRGFFFRSLRPDRLWGLPSLLSNGYRGSFPRG